MAAVWGRGIPGPHPSASPDERTVETVVSAEACHSHKTVAFEDSLTTSVSVGDPGIDVGRREHATCVCESRADCSGGDPPTCVILADPVAESEAWRVDGDEIDPADEIAVGGDPEHQWRLRIPVESFGLFRLIGVDVVRIIRSEMADVALQQGVVLSSI